MNGKRVIELDGFRGMAIALVVLYHYFKRWAPASGQGLYPYRDAFADVPIVADGAVGVFLFFIISGFVIFQTLGRSRSIAHFSVRRVDRLLLPMVVLSSLTFLLMSGPLATRYLDVTVADFLPSWTFTTPDLWKWVNPNVSYIDGAYWTLFAEVRFYVLMAVIWFFLPQRHASVFVAGCAVIAVTLVASFQALGFSEAGQTVEYVLFPSDIALFASGVVYSEIMSGGFSRRRILLLAVLVPLSLLGLSYGTLGDSRFGYTVAWVALFHAMFVALLLRLNFMSVFAWPGFVFVGEVSYSLYLLHQKIGVALISRLPGSLPMWVYPIFVVGLSAGMTVLAAISRRYLESQKWLSDLFEMRGRAVTDR